MRAVETQMCIACSRDLPREDFGAGRWGVPRRHSATCKECCATYARERRGRVNAERAGMIRPTPVVFYPPDVRYCVDCQEVRPIEDFYVHSKTRRTAVCRECQVHRARQNRATRLASIAAGARRRRKEQRSDAVAIYGGRCVECGDTEGLDFDHVNNDGSIHRTWLMSPEMAQHIVSLGRPLQDFDIQLLCQDCHVRKTAATARLRMRSAKPRSARGESAALDGLMRAGVHARVHGKGTN